MTENPTPTEPVSRYVERREATSFHDTIGEIIRRWDWVVFCYYDGTNFAVNGGEGPVMKHENEWMVIQICPYEVICTPLADLTRQMTNSGVKMWVRGWIDVPDCPHGLWKPLKHIGPRPCGSESND